MLKLEINIKVCSGSLIMQQINLLGALEERESMKKFLSYIGENSKDIEQEFADIINEHFFEIIGEDNNEPAK